MTVPLLPTPKDLMKAALEIGQSYVGESRDNAAGVEQITHFLGLYGLPYSPETAFCKPGVDWCFCKALANFLAIPYTPETAVEVFRQRVAPLLSAHYFPVNPSCSGTVNAINALNNRQMQWYSADEITTDTVIPVGAQIYYTWSPGEHHVELIIKDAGDNFMTLGMNTSCPGHSSGVITDKKRDWQYVWGFIF